MARLMMVSKEQAGGADVAEVLHPRRGVGIGKFRIKQIIAWNINGLDDSIVTGAESVNYGVIELYNSDHSIPTAADLMMRIPVSSKSRINLTIPEKGITFDDGIWVKVGDEGNDNDDKKIYLQLVGYELG